MSFFIHLLSVLKEKKYHFWKNYMGLKNTIKLNIKDEKFNFTTLKLSFLTLAEHHLIQLSKQQIPFCLCRNTDRNLNICVDEWMNAWK